MNEWLHAIFLLAQEQAAAPESKSLLEYIQSGRLIGYVIILLSFVAVGLIIAQLVRIRVNYLAPEEMRAHLDHMLAHGEVGEAIAYCRDEANDSFLCRVVGAALVRCSRSPFGFLELKSAMEEAGQEETARLYRATDAVGLIASVAPMLGLLGTVVGMVGAFDTISITEGVTRPDQLAGSISQALITTVMGLTVAIPATAAFTYLRNRIDSVAARIAEMTEELASHLESGGTAQKQPSGQQAPPSRPRPGPRSSGAPAGAEVHQA